jgi:small GTP-binding protein
MDLDNFRKLVICGVHIGELNDPIVLKCMHVFCRTCIIKYVKDCERKISSKDCPICNKSIDYSIEELTRLQASTFHKNLIETIHVQDDMAYETVSNEIKISLLGSSSCGKSSLMRSLAGLPFNDQVNCTIGVDFITVNVKNGKKITKVYLWDTAGQELYRTMIRYYYRNSKGIMLVYDVTNESSFNDIELWLEQIKENCNSDDELVILLIGNKIDLVEQRVVTYERAVKLANRYNLLYFETSAKTGEKVLDSMERLVSKINSFIQFSQNHEIISPNQLLLDNSKDKYGIRNCYCS